ncbi:chorismate synthase [bacterium]|nr:chorismate synthase [bacterium]
MPLRILTAGESHGPALTAIIEGLPAGLHLDREAMDHQLARRQRGYGRGGRMQIESDRTEITSGLRFGVTLGSPLTLTIANRDRENWRERMAVWEGSDDDPVRVPRPGHADLAGALKYGHRDLRSVLERASARETATRVAVGAVLRQLLAEFGIWIGGHVIRTGMAATGDSFRTLPADNRKQYETLIRDLCGRAAESDVGCGDPETAEMMKKEIDNAMAAGDSLGGVFETAALGVPAGLGSNGMWDRRLDAAIGAAMMSIPGIKAVEIGLGTEAASLPGSRVHDPILSAAPPFPGRGSNNAGGIEGGISNGQPLIVRAAMKPIPTLTGPLPSVNIETGEKTGAHRERSDVCAVPAAEVVGEAMLAIALADALIERTGGDSLDRMKRGLDI